MMRAARDGAFAVLIVESLDRISRDQEDLSGIYKRLSFIRVDIIAVHEGRADHIQVGLRGLFGVIFLKDLADKVHRGMAGVTRGGRHAGGRTYGYRAIAGRPGELMIEPTEAAVVRRIFSEYALGRNPRAIAQRLNADGILAPRGKFWSASTLTGNASRGHGILVNPIYGGRIVWNRVQMIKNPDTGKRVSRPNPDAKWMTVEVPHLAIVDDELFGRVQERRAARAGLSQPLRRAPRHLPSGLLKCGCCGGGMSIKDRDHGRLRIVCTRARESAGCDNRKTFYLDEIEQRLTVDLRTHLGSKAAADLYLRTYNDERRRIRGASKDEKETIQQRLASIERELERASKLLIKGVLDEAIGEAQIRELKSERLDLQKRLQATEAGSDVVSLHPGGR